MLLIAHRGDKKNFPENTPEAFRSALKKGAGGIEFDVHVENNQAIIVHDYLHTPKNYPKLQEVLEEFGSQTHLEIEIKSFSKEGLKIISQTINKFLLKDVEITSSIHPLIPYVKEAFPKHLVGEIFPDRLFEEWMTNEFLEHYFLGYLQLTKAGAIHLPTFIFNTQIIKSLKKKGYLLHHHLKTDNKEDYEKLVNLGIDFATFDDINLLEKIK